MSKFNLKFIAIAIAICFGFISCDQPLSDGSDYSDVINTVINTEDTGKSDPVATDESTESAVDEGSDANASGNDTDVLKPETTVEDEAESAPVDETTVEVSDTNVSNDDTVVSKPEEVTDNEVTEATPVIPVAEDDTDESVPVDTTEPAVDEGDINETESTVPAVEPEVTETTVEDEGDDTIVSNEDTNVSDEVTEDEPETVTEPEVVINYSKFVITNNTGMDVNLFIEVDGISSALIEFLNIPTSIASGKSIEISYEDFEKFINFYGITDKDSFNSKVKVLAVDPVFTDPELWIPVSTEAANFFFGVQTTDEVKYLNLALDEDGYIYVAD